LLLAIFTAVNTVHVAYCNKDIKIKKRFTVIFFYVKRNKQWIFEESLLFHTRIVGYTIF